MGRVDNLTPRKVNRYRPGDSSPLHRGRPIREFTLPLRPTDRRGGRGQSRQPAIKAEHPERDAPPPRAPATLAPAPKHAMSLQSQVDDLHDALIVRKGEIHKLNQAQLALKHKYMSAEDELAHDKRLIRSLKETAEKQRDTLRNLRMQVDGMKRRQDKVSRMEKEARQWQQEREEQQAMIQSAAQIRRNDQATIANLRQSVDILTTQVQDRNGSIKEMESLVLQAASHPDKKEAIEIALNAQATTTLNMINDLNAANERAEHKAVQQQAAHDHKIRELECKIKAQASVIERSKSDRESASTTIQGYQQTLARADKAVDEKNGKIAELEKTIAGHESRMQQVLGIFQQN